MKRTFGLAPVLSLLAVPACTGKEEPSNNVMMDAGTAEEGGRYAGIGTYPSDGLWNDIEGAAATNDAQAARQGDDSQIIVMVDRRTGEVRQCGNLSGFCIAMNPWKDKDRPAVQQLPVQIDRHVSKGNTAANATEAEPAKPETKVRKR